MPKCLNNPSKRYTGNENTPKGKGYIASAEKIGKKMRGTDGNMYVVSKKGGNKRWVKASIQTKTSQMSPMTKRKQKKKKKSSSPKGSSFPDESSLEESGEDSSDEEEIEWKLDAAEERCKLSDVFCTDYLLASVASLAWSYFTDWYRRVKYGEDPYDAYEDVSSLK